MPLRGSPTKESRSAGADRVCWSGRNPLERTESAGGDDDEHLRRSRLQASHTKTRRVAVQRDATLLPGCICRYGTQHMPLSMSMSRCPRRAVPARIALLLTLATACTEAPPAIESLTELSATSDTVGPYVVQAVITGVTGEEVELHYRIDDDRRYIPLPMRQSEQPERYSAALPGRPAGTVISYYVVVLRDGDRVAMLPEGAAAAPFTFTITP